MQVVFMVLSPSMVPDRVLEALGDIDLDLGRLAPDRPS